MPSPIFALAEEYVERHADLYPAAAIEQGLRSTIERLPDYSIDGHAAQADLDLGVLNRLRRLSPANDHERIAADYMAERLSAGVAFDEAGEHLRPLRNWGALPSIRQVFDHLPKATGEDWDRLAGLLGQVPAALAGLRGTLEAGVAERVVATRRQVSINIDRARRWSSSGPDGFFPQLVAGAPRDLSAAAVAAAAAYGKTAQYLADHYLAMADPRDGVGAEAYSRWCRSYLGGDIDAVATYAWAWDEVHRLSAAIQHECDQVEAGADLRRVRELLSDDDSGWVYGPEAYRDWFQQLLDDAVGDLDGRHFDIPAPIRDIEVVLSPPDSSMGPYYSPPTEDFSRPGRVWISTGGRRRVRPLWATATAFHEGVPGHHLQNGQVRLQTNTLTRYQRLFYLNFHGEGWALYAEELMDELGYIDNPEAKLSILTAQRLRAARVVLDIGLHLEMTIPSDQPFRPGQRWSYETAVAFLESLGQGTDGAHSQVNRYLAAPAQAITYKLGHRAWHEARAATKAATGTHFDLKTFHTTALALGPSGYETSQPRSPPQQQRRSRQQARRPRAPDSTTRDLPIARVLSPALRVSATAARVRARSGSRARAGDRAIAGYQWTSECACGSLLWCRVSRFPRRAQSWPRQIKGKRCI